MSNQLTPVSSQDQVSSQDHLHNQSIRPPDADQAMVPISDQVRTFLLVVVLGYCAFIAIAWSMQSSFGRSSIVVPVSSIILVLSGAFPLIVRFQNSGYLNPLVMTSAVAFCADVIGKTGFFVSGLDYNVGVPGLRGESLDMLTAAVNGVTAVGSFSVYAGYVYSSSLRRIPVIVFDRSPNSYLKPLTLLWLALGILSLFLIISASGGYAAHIKNITRGASNRSYEEGSRLYLTLGFIVQSLIIVPAIIGLRDRKSHHSILFFIATAIAIVAIFSMNGRRSAIIPPLVLACAVWTFKEKGFPMIRAVGIGFMIVIFVSIGGLFRQYHRGLGNRDLLGFLKGRTISELLDRSLGEISTRAGSSNAVYPIVYNVPSKVEFTYGLPYLENFYRFVPRAIWKDKPRGIGIRCAETFFNRHDSGGIPPTSVGEAFWAFHLPGVVIVFALYGVVLKVLQNSFLQNPESMAVASFYMLSVFRLAPNQIAFRIWIFTVIPLLIFLYLCRAVRFRL